ncbi:electron transfer flavoprotein subunit beta/FixA family protein [Pontiella agarivorans]|uniref:Electron transfer flavoprotein subunit beta/FixA family protein n=1 Tax=Pontiella agarivorans TaxID=3038953 RepID=A0ABU5N0B4_9BACT|nr:electron transfer flavoprotein subunit beta/FixA family protein [Pontiella agarivorans]MDZ8119791.1 electron transfer flavoprotein subunit beta/FixA family protein [Pontiella agarivorans]
MKIIVCIKQVPEQGRIRVDPKTGGVDRGDGYAVMNPYDESALETALRLKDVFDAEITVVSMGPPQAEAILRKSLSCGADHAFLISDPAFGGSDALATSYILSLALKTLDFDLLLFGRQAIDGDTGQVGPETACLLDLPVLTCARSIKPVSGGFEVECISDSGSQCWNIQSPCALTVIKENNELREPHFELRMSAKRAVIPILGRAELKPEAGRVGVSGSPTRVVALNRLSVENEGEMLTGSVPEMVAVLIDRLEKRGALK